MEHDITSKTNWYLLTIEDPNFLPGKSFIQIIQLAQTITPFNYVILNDLEGCGSYGLIESLQKMQNSAIDLNYLIDKITGIEHFDWCDFFLFNDFPEGWKKPKDLFYPQSIAQTKTTLRAVDGQYIYLYTPIKEIADLVKQNYCVESFTCNDLENLDYPY